MSYQLAALLSAALWAVSSLINAAPARELGGPRFTRIRMLYVSVILAGVTTWLGEWGFTRDEILLLGLSGLVGLLIFDERFTLWSGLGAVLTVVGVALAVAFGTASFDASEFERVEGSFAAGIAWATVGALGQALGAILAKPVVEEASAFGAATWRALIATVALWLAAPQLDRIAKSPRNPGFSWRYFWLLLVGAVLGMVIGMTLVLYALGKGDAGVVTILAATTPVLMLPMMWASTRVRPPAFAWLGAALTVFGAALLVR